MTTLKGFNSIGRTLVTTQLEVNVEQFLNWGLLCKGNFTNITIPSQGVHGGNYHRLRATESAGYTAGQVWQGFRGDWVWESGIEYDTQPIAVSGVNVNGTFYPLNTTGDYAYRIDYPNGEVVFNNPLPLNSMVTCEFSVRHFHVERAGRSKWFQDVTVGADRVDSVYFDSYGSGELEYGRQKTAQLPVIVVETAPNARFPKGLHLGGGSWLHQDIHLYVFASNKYERDQAIDMLKMQNEKRFRMFDVDEVDSNQAWLLNNSIGPSTRVYPDWVRTYPWKLLRLTNANCISLGHPSYALYTGTVLFTAELAMSEV